MTRPWRRHTMSKAILSDMDGVIYRGKSLVEGAKDFIRRLLETRTRFLFLTNTSEQMPLDLLRKLEGMGIAGLGEQNFYTSAMATAAFLHSQSPRGSAYVIGGNGLASEIYKVGFSLLPGWEQARGGTFGPCRPGQGRRRRRGRACRSAARGGGRCLRVGWQSLRRFHRRAGGINSGLAMPLSGAGATKCFSALQGVFLLCTLERMIPHAEFERAINQWKIRQQGGQVVSRAEGAASGAVMTEMPTANAEPSSLSVEITSGEHGGGGSRPDFDSE